MTQTPSYLDRPTAEQLLARFGFNPLDIECVLDLIAPRIEKGIPVWPVRPLERLAVRAYWVGEQEFATPFERAIQIAA